ncbi:MAG TPA: HAMP domain-containing sensor histidine kinase [Ruminiclostridium sp.]
MDLRKTQKIKRPVKLRTIFIRYLSVFCIATLLMVAILVISFSILLSSGAVYPANYTEKQVLAVREAILTSETVTSDSIPNSCKYALYTTDGNMISGNLNLKDAKKAWKLLQQSEKGQDFSYFYLKIPRKNEVYIIRYSIVAQFSSPTLRTFLPNPELLGILLFCFGFLLEVIILAYTFGKKFTQEMSSLQNATEKIQNQDLDFLIESSGIFEIDNALFSIDKMKEALKVSLKKQWKLEQTRREQISALAHDIKTPITIVRGNVELLIETNQTEQQKEYTNYIVESTHQMEHYIKTLIEISKAEMGYDICHENIESKKYLDEICSNINALTAIKKLKVDFSMRNLPQFFSGDSDLLQRAIMNVASNAVAYSQEHSKIDFIAEATEDCIRFCIIDYGKGFSSEDLKQATEQFYMGNLGRSSKSHYGMGLYITKSIIKLHGGMLYITNSPVTGGAQVTIELPICK